MKRALIFSVSIGIMALGCASALAINEVIIGCELGPRPPDPSYPPSISIMVDSALIEPLTSNQLVTVTFNVTTSPGQDCWYHADLQYCRQWWECLKGSPPPLTSYSWQVSPGAPTNAPDHGNFSFPTNPPNTQTTLNCSATFIPQQSGTITFTANATGAGTADVSIPFTVLSPMRLGYWRFNNTNWIGEEGQIPYVADNILNVTNWNYGALQVNSYQSILGYNAFRSDGMPNITHNTGTIRFWFKPNWNSGSGPGNDGKLFEMSSGWWETDSGWCLSVDSRGNNIILASKGDPDPNAVINLIRAINWTSSQWHQIVVTYSQSTNNVAIYVDGFRLGDHAYIPVNGAGISSFTIGNGANGFNPAMGLFDELETFNYVLSPADIISNYQLVSRLDTDGDGLSNLQEVAIGTDPYNPDTDGDGVLDDADYFPLDPNRWDPINPNDITPPVIQLLEPVAAVQIP